MTDDRDPKRRDFLRMALTSVGAIACPWPLHPALAATPGRAIVGFQVLPTWMHLFSALLAEIRVRYEPDLGTKAVLLPGGAGMQAIEALHRSPRDGATVLFSASTALTVAPARQSRELDPLDAVVPVAGIGMINFGFSVGPAVPAHVRTMNDYAEWVRANPALNNYGVSGLKTVPHYIGHEIGLLANVSMRAVAYRGSVAIADDVANGHIPAGVMAVLGPDEIARRPALRLLAVAANQRLPQKPDVPTLQESGCGGPFPGVSLGLFMPQGTPETKVEQLSAAVEAALRTRPVTDAMAGTLIGALPESRESYAMAISAEREKWRALAARNGFINQA